MTKLQQYLRLMFVWFTAIIAINTLFPSLVSAAGIAEPINGGDTVASLRVSALFVQAIVAVFIPILVGLVTNVNDQPKIKGALEIVVTAVSALIVQATLADGSAVFTEQTVLVWLVGLGASLVAYAKVWKPAGITSSAVQLPGSAPGRVVSVPGKLSGLGIRRVA